MSASTPFSSHSVLPKSLLKRYTALKQKKYRNRYQLFVAEGLRTVEQLIGTLNAGSSEEISCAAEALILPESAFINANVKKEYEALIGKLNSAYTGSAQQRPDVYTADAKSLSQLSDTRQTQGVIGIFQMPFEAHMQNWLAVLHHPESTGTSLILALDDISDPGNMGTLCRSAAWFGFDGLMMSRGCVDLFNPKVVRSTAGALGNLSFAECKLSEELKGLHDAGYHVFLLDLNAKAISIYDAFKHAVNNHQDSSDALKLVIVIGNEAHGISQELREQFTAVFIPGSSSAVESLNAGVSGSIAMSSIQAELQRQRAV
jgi:TrmH family RNA methyltransferase